MGCTASQTEKREMNREGAKPVLNYPLPSRLCIFAVKKFPPQVVLVGIVPTGSVIQSPSWIKEYRPPDRIPLLRTPSAENKNKPVIRALEIEEDSTLQLPGFSMADWRGGRLVRGR